VSEWILNGTSAQLGYTVPFTLKHVGKYRTVDTLKIQTIQKLNTTQKKQTMQNKSTVAFYDIRPGNEVGLFYNAAKPTWGCNITKSCHILSIIKLQPT